MYKNCVDCNKPLSLWAKYEPIKRCRNCSNKYSYKKRLPTKQCIICKKDYKVTSFIQKYCKKCMNDDTIRKQYRAQKNKKTWEKYPEKRKARTKAGNHIRIKIGTLCERCKKNFATDRHHKDYTKPLDIIKVCKKCHTILDKKMKR